MITGPAGAGGSRDKGEAEQVLLDKALKDYRYLFTPWRLWVMDRNFPGVPRIKALLAAGTHVLIRIRDGITLRRAGDFLPDGSYLAEISGSGITLTVRVIEYTVTVADRDAPELFCLITDLHHHAAYPASQLAQAYHWRWIGSETCLKEAKSAISGAGPSTGPMLRSASPPLIRQEQAAWVIAVELARATARAAAAVAIPARRGRRAGSRCIPARSRSPPPAGPSSPPPGGRGDRQLARRPHRGEPGRHPGWPGQAPRPGRPLPAPQPQDQGPARLPAGRPAPRDPHRASRDQRLPAPDRLTPGNTRWPVEPAAARSDSLAPRHVHHSP